MVATYFQNKRALATGIASCGSGIGALVMAPIISLLDNNLGWGYSMMLLGTLMLACIPLGILFRPIANKVPSVHQDEKSTSTPDLDDKLDCTKRGATSGQCCLLLGKLMPTCSGVLIICCLSNFLFNLGFAAPYVYTVVRKK